VACGEALVITWGGRPAPAKEPKDVEMEIELKLGGRRSAALHLLLTRMWRSAV